MVDFIAIHVYLLLFTTCAITITWEKLPMACTHVPIKSLT